MVPGEDDDKSGVAVGLEPEDPSNKIKAEVTPDSNTGTSPDDLTQNKNPAVAAGLEQDDDPQNSNKQKAAVEPAQPEGDEGKVKAKDTPEKKVGSKPLKLEKHWAKNLRDAFEEAAFVIGNTAGKVIESVKNKFSNKNDDDAQKLPNKPENNDKTDKQENDDKSPSFSSIAPPKPTPGNSGKTKDDDEEKNADPSFQITKGLGEALKQTAESVKDLASSASAMDDDPASFSKTGPDGSAIPSFGLDGVTANANDPSKPQPDAQATPTPAAPSSGPGRSTTSTVRP